MLKPVGSEQSLPSPGVIVSISTPMLNRAIAPPTMHITLYDIDMIACTICIYVSHMVSRSIRNMRDTRARAIGGPAAPGGGGRS